MPTLNLSNFNIVCATLGGFISLFGLVSYLCKEKFYLSEALISTLAGAGFGPHAANFIRPTDYALNDAETLDVINLYFTRLVLGVQLVLAGVQLPSRYLLTEWRSLALLLGPGMALMWLATSLLVWAMVPGLTFLPALAVGACVTPTDPVLSNSILKGKFADRNIPKDLARLIIAESGANDGLGYPFLFLPLYLIQYTGGGPGQPPPQQLPAGGVGRAMALWVGETWGYIILLSVVYGAVVGWVAKVLLHWAEQRRYVDRESFLVFAITLALFIVGTGGSLDTDDILAAFVAGNTFTWDDWFRLETEDDSLQPTIDMLLNAAIFIWFGAVCPWPSFLSNQVISLPRLVGLGILVLLLRRLPAVLAMHRFIPQIEHVRQASFVGFFGPMGVSAVFYLYAARAFLRTLTVDGVQREDARHLEEVMTVVIWFLVICSIVVHGLSIPVGKLGLAIPRSLSMSAAPSSDGGPSTEYTGSVLWFRGRRGSGAANSAVAPVGSSSGPMGRITGPFSPRPLFHTVRDGGFGRASPPQGQSGGQQQRQQQSSSLPPPPSLPGPGVEPSNTATTPAGSPVVDMVEAKRPVSGPAQATQASSPGEGEDGSPRRSVDSQVPPRALRFAVIRHETV